MIGTVLLVGHVTSAEGHVIPQTMTSSCNERERTKASYDMIGTVLLVGHVTSAEGHVIPWTMTSSCNEKERELK